MKGKSGDRVWWTDEEKEQLTDLVFGMQTNNPEKSLTVLLAQAQHQIPPHRRRKVFAFSSIPWMISGLRLRYGRLKEAQRNASPYTPPAAPVVQRPVEEVVREAPTQLLVQELCGRFFTKAEKMEQAFAMLDRLASDTHNNRQPVALVASTTRKPKAFIVGLKEGQAAEIKNRFEERVEFAFHFSGQASLKSGEVPEGQIFCMKKWTDHPTYWVLKKAGSVKEINGGMSDLSTSLTGWLASQ
jgi:hypothetical protein